ncbi:MAG: hypothetical protein KAI99_11935, partial [Cyclobacteriaceae bacterium]|nr:hypothetical protein [Cyclobacteriaceae bacterium]
VDIIGVNLGCISTKEYTLLHQPTTVSILSTDITNTNQTICGPNASIVLNRIFEDDGSGPIPTGPDYTGIYNAQLLDQNLDIIDPLTNTYAAFNPLIGEFGSNNIPAATYYVQASNVVTGCAFGPSTQVIIKDVSKNPIISATLDNPDYSCIGGTATGELTPIVFGGTDNDDANLNPARFSVTWIKNDGTNPITDDGGGTWLPRAINLDPVTYTMEVTDNFGNDQFCVSTRDYIVTAARHDIDITASGTDQTFCIPNGTIQIDNIDVDGVNVIGPHLAWTAILLDDSNNPVSPAPTESGFASNSDPLSNLYAGAYFVQAQDNLTKCYSDPYQVVINDISENPVIAIDITSPQYSLNPNPASWTGAMQATVTELSTGAPDAGGYIYSWHLGNDDSNPSLSGLDNVSALDEGYYTFTAFNNNTGCESTYTQYMPFVYLEPLFNTSISPQTICSPYNGSIEITDISLDGAPDMLSDYTFNWHHDIFNEGDTPDAIIPGNDVRTAYDNLNSGSYYILAKENWWMIESYPVKVEVIDSTTNPIITFDATNYQPLTSCDESVFSDGALAVEVYEDNTNPYLIPPFNYSYAWYAGDKVNAANVITDSVNYSISGLPSGEFTILVTNLGNNCQSENTFTIEDNSIIPIVAASQTPNTNCPIDIANGIIRANVINSTSGYNYQWYEGTETNGNPDYQGSAWHGRPVDNYTVIAIDQQFGTCVSEPVIIQVEDATVHPTILINELAPVTNCDPERPNGVLSAVTQDGIDGHTFEWYLNEELYATGPVASNLGLLSYQLVVTNDASQCETALEAGPTQLLSVVPRPDVDILNDRTSCLEPDGAATASVLGNVTDYIFRYYNKFSGDELNNLYVDFNIHDLDTSTYLVTAEDRTTGCISKPTEFAISNESYFPEIDVIAHPSNCQEPSGDATVIISDMTRDFKVTWYSDNGFIAQEKEIVYIPVGKYRVEV